MLIAVDNPAFHSDRAYLLAVVKDLHYDAGSSECTDCLMKHLLSASSDPFCFVVQLDNNHSSVIYAAHLSQCLTCGNKKRKERKYRYSHVHWQAYGGHIEVIITKCARVLKTEM